MAFRRDKQAEKDWQNYKSYRNTTLDWRTDRDRYEKFYFGQQHSTSEGQKLEANKQSDVVINKIRPLIRQRVSMMIANKPTGHILGVRKEDTDTATLLNDFADWHMHNSYWGFHLERAVMGQNRVGIHWLSLYDDPVADYGRGELKVGNESFRYVYLDKAAGNKWDFSDAARIINTKQRRPDDWHLSLPKKIRDRISVDDLQQLVVPDDEIRWSGEGQHRQQDDIGNPVTIDPTDERLDPGQWIREMDVYEKVMIDVPIAVAADGIMYVVGDPDDGFSEEIEQQIAEGALFERTAPQTRWKFRKSISGKMLLPLDGNNMKKTEDILPLEDPPLIPIVDEDTGNSMPFGEIDFQAGIQELVNASISLTILNASLSSNTRLLADGGKLGEEAFKKLEKRWAIPGSVHNLPTDPVTGDFPIKEFVPQPLSHAWFTMFQALSAEVEFQASRGLNLRAGDPSQAPETFSATLQLGQWAQDILRIPLSRLELGLERLYNLIFQWAPHYYSFEKIFYTLPADGIPVYQSINFLTLQQLKARYRIRSGSTLPSQVIGELGVMQELAQTNPALIGAVIDRLPGLREAEKQELKQSVDLVAQLSQENERKDQVIGVLQQQIQHLGEQVFALQQDQALDVVKREADLLAKSISDTRKGLEKENNQKPKAKR